MLTIESLDPRHIIWMQLEVGPVASIDRSHECLGISGVPKSQGMAHLMGRNDAQVHSLVGPLGPEFIFIEMYTSKLWDVSMGQDLSWNRRKVSWSPHRQSILPGGLYTQAAVMSDNRNGCVITHDTSTRKVDTGGSEAQDQPQEHSRFPISLGCMRCRVHHRS